MRSAAFSTSVYMGSTVFSSGLDSFQTFLSVPLIVVELGTTLFVWGYAVGPMLWSPLSGIPVIGRNPLYIGTLGLFFLLQLPIIFASNVQTVLIFRFITGFLGAPCLATRGASLADICSTRKRPYAIGLWGLSLWAGTVIGTSAGGWAAQYNRWRWPIWELFWTSGAVLLLISCLLPETSGANILYRRTR